MMECIVYEELLSPANCWHTDSVSGPGAAFQTYNILAVVRIIGKPAPGKETAFDLMPPCPFTVPPDLPVVDAVKKMLAESRKWLVVIDENDSPLGLVDRQILLESVRDY